MNLDRLLKLLKLANHNPNDAEANSAARAAGKLLGEENYKWLEDAKKNGGKPPSNRQANSTINYDPITGEYNIKITESNMLNNPRMRDLVVQLQREVNEVGTWAGVHRSTEPQWGSTPPPPRGSPFEYGDPFGSGGPFDSFNDTFWEDINRRAKKEQRKQREAQAQNWTWTGERSGNKGHKKVYQQKCRDCTVCKITRLTTDEETPYVCYYCKRKV